MAENPLLSNLVAAWGGDESAIPEHEVEPFPDETRSPLVNDLIRLARRYVSGMSAPLDFVWGMQSTINNLRVCLFEHREMLPLLRLTPEQSQLAHEAEVALYSLLEALGEMVASFTMEDLPLVEIGIDLCKKSTATLEVWYDELAVLQRAEFGMVCAQCGHYAQPSATECPICRHELPGLEEEYDPEQDWAVSPGPYTALFEKLLESVEAAGQEPDGPARRASQLLDKLNMLKASVVTLTGLDPAILEHCPAVIERVEDLLHAIESTRVALLGIQAFPAQRDLGALDAAWYHLVDALPLLNSSGFEARHALIGLLDYLNSDAYQEDYEEAVDA